MNQAHRSAGKIAPRFDHPPPYGWSGRSRGSKSDLKYSQPQCLLSPNELTSSARAVTSEKCHKRKSIGADVDLYARPVDGRRTRAISQTGIAHNAVCRINRRSSDWRGDARGAKPKRSAS